MNFELGPIKDSRVIWMYDIRSSIRSWSARWRPLIHTTVINRPAGLATRRADIAEEQLVQPMINLWRAHTVMARQPRPAVLFTHSLTLT